MLPKIYTLIISAFCISSLAAMDPAENQSWEKKLAELTNADSATQEKTRSAFAQENRLRLFQLSHRFDHDELVQAAKPSPSTQKIVSKEGSTVVAVPEAAHHIALNKDGSAVAIAHGNKLKVLQKNKAGQMMCMKIPFGFRSPGWHLLKTMHLLMHTIKVFIP